MPPVIGFVLLLVLCAVGYGWRSRLRQCRLQPLRAQHTGVEQAVEYLNSEPARKLLLGLALQDVKLKEEINGLNFWSNCASIKAAKCTGISPNGVEIDAICEIKGKAIMRKSLAPFPSGTVEDESQLKLELIKMATICERSKDTAGIASLQFGYDCSMPSDFLFNQVPHAPWVRNYLNSRSTQAVLRAINDPTIPSNLKSRMQIKINVPEVNPAFDTYRMGTLLELAREIVLALAVDEGKRVRICVQQPLGEGVFVGMPLALASMRVVLEKMDWGSLLSAEQKWRPGDQASSQRKEALIRLGTIGAEQAAEDDDVFIVMAPQNVVGGMIVDELEAMVKAAAGRPLVLINPILADRPSSNNVMQIRGRAERRAFTDSFVDIFALRLLYPSSGGYMFPISGLISKKGWREPWCCYAREEGDSKGKEEYKLVAAFPPHPPPDPSVVSAVYTM